MTEQVRREKRERERQMRLSLWVKWIVFNLFLFLSLGISVIWKAAWEEGDRVFCSKQELRVVEGIRSANTAAEETSYGLGITRIVADKEIFTLKEELEILQARG